MEVKLIRHNSLQKYNNNINCWKGDKTVLSSSRKCSLVKAMIFSNIKTFVTPKVPVTCVFKTHVETFQVFPNRLANTLRYLKGRLRL